MSRRICFITNFCPPYREGAFRLLAEKAPVDFFFTSRGEEAYWNKNIPPVEDARSFRTLSGFTVAPGVKITPGLIPILLSGRYRTVIKCINGKFALPAAFLLAKLTGKKFILWQTIWYHPRTLVHRLTWPLLRVIQSFADAVVVYGEHGRRYLRRVGVDARKIRVAWQAVDNTLFGRPVGEEEKRSTRASLGVEGRKVVLFVGRLVEVKGLPWLIDALARFREDRPALVMIGDGPMRSALERRMRERGLERDVVFVPHVDNDDLPRYYAVADVVVLPSVTTPSVVEAWGLVLNEAMNQGRPVVATDAVGAAVGGLVRHGENGLVVPERDADALQEAIALIVRDDARREKMGRAAKETMRDWDFRKMVGGFLESIAEAERKR